MKRKAEDTLQRFARKIWDTRQKEFNYSIRENEFPKFQKALCSDLVELVRYAGEKGSPLSAVMSADDESAYKAGIDEKYSLLRRDQMEQAIRSYFGEGE